MPQGLPRDVSQNDQALPRTTLGSHSDYGEQPSTTSTYSFEIDGIFAQAGSQPYPPWTPQIEFAGVFERVGTTLEFDFERCDPQYDIDVPPIEYSATANGMLTFETDSYGTRIVISYLRE